MVAPPRWLNFHKEKIVGYFVFRVAAGACLVCMMITYLGCKQMRSAWSAPSKPKLVQLDQLSDDDVAVGSYIKVDDFMGVDVLSATESRIYMPWATPPAEGQMPETRQQWTAFARKTQIIVSAPRDADVMNLVDSMSEGIGVIRGTADKVCPKSVQKDLENQLGFTVESLPVLELGGHPPSFFLGLLTSLGGMVGFLGTAYVAMKPYVQTN